MPKLSKDSAPETMDNPMAEDRFGEVDGIKFDFVTIRQGHDLAPILKGLPDDRCTCPHWGYVFKGRLTWTFEDHEEVFEAGDAFYVPPGHTPAAEAGSEFMQMSPAEEMRPVEEMMKRNMEAMATGG